LRRSATTEAERFRANHYPQGTSVGPGQFPR
jgi:hypothetical protein